MNTASGKKVYWKAVLVSLPAAILIALLLRLGIYLWLRQSGYFYGIPWDSFPRTLSAYYWSQRPTFAGGGYWMPFCSWLVGSVYFVLKPWIKGSEILVPVAVNNLFLVGSLIITYLVGNKIGGKSTGFLACLLAGVFAGDVFISYTALSEPVLVFFILLASYFLIEYYQAVENHRGWIAVKIGLASLLAATTHYIGWFLAAFACIVLLPGIISSVKNKSWRLLSVFLFAIALCILIPAVWLLNSYLQFGDLFHSLNVAKEYQADSIGRASLGTRLLIPIRVLINNFPAITIAGCLSILLVFTKRRWALMYLAAPGFVFGMVWLSTGLALSAPNQEPRYLVFLGWAMIPIISLAGDILWQAPGYLGKIAVSIAVILIMATNLNDMRGFQNSISPDVRAVAAQAEVFLQQNSTAFVIMESTNSIERWGIPVLSKQPERTYSVKRGNILSNSENLDSFFSDYGEPWLAIVIQRKIARLARDQGLSVKQVGGYYLISPQNK